MALVLQGTCICPRCGGLLKHYNHVSRIVKKEYGLKYKIRIRRLKCLSCGSIHRELPNNLFPYKHYAANIIIGFVNEELSTSDLRFEDYPCDLTIKEWKEQYSKIVIADFFF